MVNLRILSVLSCFAISACLVDANKQGQAGKSSTGATESGKSSAQPDSTGDSSNSNPKSNPKNKPKGEGDETKQACDSLDDALCVWNAPLGWRGPIQPQRAVDPKDLTPCTNPTQDLPGFARSASGSKDSTQPSTASNIFVESVDFEPARCEGGCSHKLETGTCGAMTLAIRELDPSQPNGCGDLSPDFLAPVLTAACQTLDPSALPSSKYALGATPPQPFQGQASCEPFGEPQATIPAPAFPTYYRICAGEFKEQGTCQPGRSCTSFADIEGPERLPMSCIYKPGQAKCPKGPYDARRILIYGSAQDTRSCGECQVKHERGELGCDYGIVLGTNDPTGTCENAEPIRAEDLCIKASDFKGPQAPWSVRGTHLAITYTGSCETIEPKAQGSIELGSPLTLCCADF